MYRPTGSFAWPNPPQGAFSYIDKVRRLLVKPYLTLPFRQRSYRVTEGWFYSKYEYEIHLLWGHAAIDFELPRGADVLAAASGWAMSSYHRSNYTGEDGRPVKYKGKEIGIGLGYFVQMYHPETGRYTLYGHLGSVDSKIPYSPARRLKDGRISPANIGRRPEEMSKHFRFVWVERGDKVGEVGDSGVNWGYDDFPDRPDPSKYPSWDRDTHLHFVELTRDLRDGSLSSPRDPYDIYWTADKYPDPERKGNISFLGPKTLWRLKNGWPELAK